jgi:hypothetical protein
VVAVDAGIPCTQAAHRLPPVQAWLVSQRCRMRNRHHRSRWVPDDWMLRQLHQHGVQSRRVEQAHRIDEPVCNAQPDHAGCSRAWQVHQRAGIARVDVRFGSINVSIYISLTRQSSLGLCVTSYGTCETVSVGVVCRCVCIACEGEGVSQSVFNEADRGRFLKW